MAAGSKFVPDAKASVAVVLVNWRQPDRTIEAFHALTRQSVPPDVVVVVDNGSGDGSAAVLKAALPEAVIVALDVNGGFGAGCNAGIECAMSMGLDYVWLLNNDAVPEARCLEYLLARAIGDPKVGVVGARISEPSGCIPDHAGCIMNPISFNCLYTLSEAEMEKSRYAWITGASMLLPVRALGQIGAFDVGYFMYWEDADICCRLRRAGFTLAVAQQAVVEHVAGTSSHQMRIKRFQWHLESQLRWVRRNYSVVIYGVFLVYMRHLVKSLLTIDGARFLMSVKVMMGNAR